MGRYIVRRVLQFIPVVLGTLFVLHYLTVVSIQLSGDPIAALFGPRQPAETTLAYMREQFGLNDPCLDTPGSPCLGIFVDRVAGYLQGDFGTDYDLRPVTALMAERWPVSLRLTAIAVAFETLVGIPAGILAGIRKDKVADNAIRVSTVLVISVPVFVLGVLVQIFAGVFINEWLGDIGAPLWLQNMFSVSYQPDYPWLSIVIPGLVLGAFSLASIARLTRTSLIENLRADYVRTARAKGLSQSRVVGVHVLRNSLIPVVTYIGLDIGFLVNGALVTEGIFDIPGIGQLVFQSILRNEVPVVLAVVTIIVVLFLVANLVVDVLYAVLDPRIRYD